MIPQNFKGDATELKMQAVVDPVLDQTDAALDDFYANGFDCNAFILMLYDEGRMPFSERIPRDAFVDFVRQALQNFPVTGTFESYLFILRSIFGSEVEVLFDVDDPGILEVDIFAISGSEFDFIAREFVNGAYEFFDMIDDEGNQLIFRGLPGIDNEYDLQLLFSEIIPAGITPHISLTFFAKYDFIAEDDDGISDMLDSFGNQIIFTEIGG